MGNSYSHQRGGSNNFQAVVKPLEAVFWKDKSKKIPDMNLFSECADKWAKEISRSDKAPKYSQIRNFYDEILVFKTKLIANKDEFEKLFPYIKMLNAKFAYAQARKVMSELCQKSFSEAINKIKDYDDFMLFTDFFESFMAFYKQYKPK
jgi:CRISPR-associated protein Csm2